MLSGNLTINKFKYYIYTFLGKVLPLIFICLAIIFKDTRFMFCFMVNALVNTGISNTEERILLSSGINYLRDVIVAGKKIATINNKELSRYINRIKEINNSIKSIDRGTRILSICNSFGGVIGEMLATPFLIEETVYTLLEKPVANSIDINYVLC